MVRDPWGAVIPATAGQKAGLELGQAMEKITLAATPPLVQAEGAAMGTVVHAKQLVELPLNEHGFAAPAALASPYAFAFRGNR